MLQPTLTAGDTLDITTALSDYPASAGWVLKLRLVPRGSGSAVTIIGTASGDAHQLQASAATTAAWTAGPYGWAAWVELGAVNVTVDSGTVEVKPDPRTITAGTDTRSAAQVALAAAEAALAAWSPTTRRYRINGREMEFNTAAEIIAVVAYWRGVVQTEQRAAQLAAGRPDPRRIMVRMNRA